MQRIRRSRVAVNVRPACLVLAAVLVAHVSVFMALGAPTAHAVEVIGDDEVDRFVGSGAVILPTGVTESARREASTCVGCRWKVTMPCRRSEAGGDAACRGFTLGCPQGREVHRAWVARPGGDFEPVGLYCPTTGEVVTVAEATQRVVDSFVRHIPRLAAVCQPTTGVVVGLPLHCRSGQAVAVISWSDQIAGLGVHTSARGRWTWIFTESGMPESFVESLVPGSPHPAPAGAGRTFTTAGVHEVAVTARWSGTFTVDGLGPFPIEQGLSQTQRLAVPVGSAIGVVRP